MNTTNLTREDIRYLDELCADDNAIDAGSGLDSALETFADHYGIELAEGEIYAPTNAECDTIKKLAVNAIVGYAAYDDCYIWPALHPAGYRRVSGLTRAEEQRALEEC